MRGKGSGFWQNCYENVLYIRRDAAGRHKKQKSQQGFYALWDLYFFSDCGLAWLLQVRKGFFGRRLMITYCWGQCQGCFNKNQKQHNTSYHLAFEPSSTDSHSQMFSSI